MIHELLTQAGIPNNVVTYGLNGEPEEADGVPIPREILAAWREQYPVYEQQQAADQEAQELGKWLERKARNDRALEQPGLRPEIRAALLRLNEKCDAEIARPETRA